MWASPCRGPIQGDTTTIADTLTAAAEDLEAVATVTDDHTVVIDEVVADKGYHSNQVLTDLAALDLRSYIAEPDRGRRNWTKKAVARDAVYANRPTHPRGTGRGLAAATERAPLNGRTRICTTPAACDGRTCEGMPTSSNDCSSTRGPATWAPAHA